MKIRLGFVSNSSSSSFIIGVGILPSNKIEEVRERLNITDRTWDMSIVNVEDVPVRGWGLKRNEEGTRLSKEAFDGSQVVIDGVDNYLKQDPGAAVLYLDASGMEPTYDEDSWEYNYDEIEESLEWFEQRELDAADIIRNECVVGSVIVGGGFDG